ncbi:MAG: NifU family protein [Alphaproteobacteria bacterium GM7ARS4]|nr:NifU family protein [Alphaproteobacteria bacterium GM7ARS4]
MFIQTEQTPNPATLKFIPGCPVLEGGTAEFTQKAEAETHSPLASRLFAIEGVVGVFLGSDFVTVTRAQNKEWMALKASILASIMEHFQSGDPVLHDEGCIVPSHLNDGEGGEVVTKIKELLDTRVRPAVAMDGGDINFSSYEDGIVYLQMRGACAGCPSSTATLKAGIENLLRHYIPEVREVRAAS